jgi:serine/threonine-protein kinase HipA
MRIAVSRDPVEQKRRSYINFAHELQRWAGAGDKNYIAGQKRELWRRIVFNGLVNNADDHPRNHGLLFEGRSWGLSPVFDVVPSVFEKPSPVLSMPFLPGRQGMVGTPENLAEAGRFFGYGKDEAKEALEAMARVVAWEWRNALRKAGMPETETDRMEPAFRLAGRISGSLSQDAGQEPEDFAPR